MTIEILVFFILYLVEALIAWLYYEHLFERKQNIRITLFLFFIGYCICFFVYEMKITWVNVILFFSVNVVLSLELYDCKFKTSVIHAAYLSFLMSICEIIIVLMIGAFGYSFDAYQHNFNVMILLIVLSKLLYLLSAMISARIFKPYKHISEEPKLMVLFCALPLISMLTSTVVAYLGLNAELTTSSEIMIIVTFMALLIVNLLFFIIYNYVQYTNHENTILQLSIKKDEANVEYYKALYEQTEDQKVLIHDIKKHLNVIANLADASGNKDIKIYVDDVVKSSELNQKKRLSDNPVLNMILLQYAQKCENKGINFVCDVRADSLKFMGSASVTAIFDNLLSNAYDASVISIEKYIEVSVIKYDTSQAVAISVINSCDIEPKKDFNGNFVSTKAQKTEHGYGLKSVIRSVNNYKGTYKFYYDSDLKQFHTIIQIPYNRT